jgi:UPF0716 protein FxsA
MLGLLILLFTVVPALEFYLLFSIGSEIGAGNTFLIIILTGIIGAFLAKMQGLSILMKMQKELNQGQMPATGLLHGFIVFGGGLLLLTPGFITDALGFCMVIPGTRHIIVTLLMKFFERGIASGNVHVFTSFQGFSSSSQQRMESDKDVFEAEFEKKQDS